MKYAGFNDYRGGRAFSGRLTAELVVTGVVAKTILGPIAIEARLIEAGGSKDAERTSVAEESTALSRTATISSSEPPSDPRPVLENPKGP